jgi:hypothetical protein
MRLGPVTLDDPIFAAIDLSDIIPGVEGVVGYPLFLRSVVELNPGGAPARLFPPGDYPRQIEQWSELVLAGRKLFLECRFPENHRGLFMLDTGARRGLVFNPSAVQRLRLLESRKTWGSGSARGVGGQTPMRDGELAWFYLAEVRFDQPVVSFAQGTHSDPYSLGTVGMGFFKYLQVVFNVPESKIALVVAQ